MPRRGVIAFLASPVGQFFQRDAPCERRLLPLRACKHADGRYWPPPQCIGDCDGDRKVAINELVMTVNIALGTGAAAACASSTRPATARSRSRVRARGEPRSTAARSRESADRLQRRGESAQPPTRPSRAFKKQIVIPSDDDVPGGKGRDINGQICFTPRSGRPDAVHRRRRHQSGAGHDTRAGASSSSPAPSGVRLQSSRSAS